MKYSLPDSANDLLIKNGKLLIKSLNIYEILRRFNHIIRLTPFKFEDFQAALLANEQSPLLSEIHIQLFKTLLREDKLQQTWLGPPDIRDSINIYLHLIDHTNWFSAIKIYLSANPRENSDILEKLNPNEFKDYPFNVTLDFKLDLLEQLCDQFLMSNLARDDIVSGNASNNDNNSSRSNGTSSSAINKQDNLCRLCAKANGDLISCSKCPAIYHLRCSDPPLENYPPEEETYTCVICRSNHVVGVSDCISEEEKSSNYKRHEALGVDKLGRRYWFLVRRLFVIDENEEDVRYYSTLKQLQEIIDSLHENRYEKSLIDNLLEKQEEIETHMQITSDLYNTLLKEYKKEDGSYSIYLGQDGRHKNYVNHYSISSNLALTKTQFHSEKDIHRTLNNKFCMNSVNSFKWHGAVDGHLTILTFTIKSTIIKFEASLPTTFLHPCWQKEKPLWIRLVNNAQKPNEYARALTKLEAAIKPILFKSSWYDTVGFVQLFRSTLAEREELKKTDRQPRGFERREWFSQDFELSYKLGTMVKFSAKLKPVKHQVWKQKGEEYRLTGLNGWSWLSCTFRSKTSQVADLKKATPFDWLLKKKEDQGQQTLRRTAFLQPKIPPCHYFMTKKSKLRSLLILPDLELKKLARSGGMKEAKSFSYTAKQNNYVWPYGMTPRPTFRSCWLYKNCIVNTVQDVSLQLKVLFASLRWDDLQVRIPASGHNVIMTEDATVTIELLKKRDRLPFLNRSEYLIKKITTPIGEPTKYRKVTVKKTAAPQQSARSGLRARRQTEEEEVRGPKIEELWVSEDQLELWELRQFDEKIERQNQILRERAIREETERKRKIEEEKRRKIEQEKRRRAEEEATKARLSNPQTSALGSMQIIRPTNGINTNQPPRPAPTTPLIRYLRTEQGQIIRLPASYLQRGTPLILRHVNPASNQTNTYIIRPQIMPISTNIVIRPTVPGATTAVASSTAVTTTTTTNAITSINSKSIIATTVLTSTTATEPIKTSTNVSANITTTTNTAATTTTTDTPAQQQLQGNKSQANTEEKPDSETLSKPEQEPKLEPQSKPEQEFKLDSQSKPDEEPKSEPQTKPEIEQAQPQPEFQPTQPEPAQQLKLQQQQQPSVGTVENEMAHDQHAPTST